MVILERKIDDAKINISITIDKNLVNNLEEIKKKKKYRKLSPQINDLLWDWLNKEEKEDANTK